MNLDDLLDYDGYDSPDYESEEEQEEDDSDNDDREEEGADEGQEDDGEEAEDEVDGARRHNNRMPEGKKLGDIEAEWVRGERGKEKVIYQGALYTVNSISASGNFIFARCDQRKGCSSRLWIQADSKRLHLLTGEHNHPAQPWRPQNAKINDAQMEMIEGDTNLAPSTVVKRTTEELTSVQQLYLPRKQNQARAVETKKRKLLGLPPAPNDINFELPDKLKTFHNGDRLLLYDSGADDNKRILIFGDSSMRPNLSGVQTIAGDGTFKRCPLQHRQGFKKHRFSQCYIIMVERASTIHLPGGRTEVNRVYLPVAHALLPAEDEDTYIRFFKALHDVLPELRLTRFKSDYERAAMNAAKKVYLGITCEGDSFHFVQAVMKRLNKLGLMDDYRAGLELYHQVRLMLTTMFVPVRRVEKYWYDVVKHLVTSENLQPHVDYMEKTWIGKPPTTTMRGVKPKFAPSLWNQHQAVIDKRPRHNNFMESNNAKLQSLIKQKPSVWDFLLGLRSAYKGDYALLYQSFVLGERTPRKTADVAKDTAIFKQTQRWADTLGPRPRLQPAEWANAMAAAMKTL